MAVSMSAPILVVNDYNTMVRILRNLLRQLGFSNIDEANNGAAALTKLRAQPYQLVISDWNMTPMTGAELLQRVRADARLSSTRFMLVGAEDSEEMRRASRAGADAFLAKPFNAQSLKQKLTGVLGAF